MEFPLISIIITTYNYAHTVGTAIESALRQDYPNLEVLVVDNASTDATPELAATYAGDARFRYVRNDTNIGMVPNHNKGLREARGSYVLFLSADDFLLPGHITQSYAYLTAHPDIDVLYSTTFFVNETGSFTGVRQMSGQPLAPYAGGRNEFAGLLIDGCYMCFPTMLMRRDLYDRFGELDESIKAADYEIVVRWAANGVRFAYLPEPSCAVRLHSAQQSSPQNYVADAGDIREFLYLVSKFADAFGSGLRDFEMSISRHMWARYSMAQQAGVRDADGTLRAALLDVDRLLAGVRARNGADPAPVRPTVIVLPSPYPGDVERTLRSLVAQTRGDWEAMVMESSGHTYAALCAYLDPKGRARSYRIIGGVGEATAIVNALRITGGNAFVVMRAGNELPPDHLERVMGAMAEPGVEVVRTSARLRVDGTEIANAYMPPSETRLPWSVPHGPIESLAFSRAALDSVQSVNERMPGFPEWELFLRLALAFPVTALDSAAIVNARSGTAEAYTTFAGLPQVASALYAAFTTDDTSMKMERDAFLRNVQRVLALGPAAAATPEGVANLYRAAGGMDLLANHR